MQFIIIRGDLIDFSEIHKIKAGSVSLNETFRKKTGFYYSNKVV